MTWTVGKMVAAAVALLLVVVLVWWFLTEPGRARVRAAQAEAAARAAQGQAAAGQAAIGTIGQNQKSGAALDQTQSETENAIRQAPPGDSNSVTLRRLCLSASYRDQPACKQLLQPSSR